MSARLVTSGGKRVYGSSLKFGQIVRWCGELCLATYNSEENGDVQLVSLEKPSNTWSGGLATSEMELLPKGTEVMITAE